MAQLLLGMTGGGAVVPTCQAPRGNGTTGVAPLADPLAGERPLVGPQVINDPRPGFSCAPRKSERPKGTGVVAGPRIYADPNSDPRPVAFPKPPIVCLHRIGES